MMVWGITKMIILRWKRRIITRECDEERGGEEGTDETSYAMRLGGIWSRMMRCQGGVCVGVAEA
eukprot:8386570-Pyramimonas_sp.AAC.1